MMPRRPPVLIERWLPIDVLSAETARERGAVNALPDIYFLHVWWARRPLTASRAAILASVLPAWSKDWPDALRERFPDEKSYERWFVRLCGIFGDPVAGRNVLLAARGSGKMIPNPYQHPRAFTVSPSEDMLAEMGDLLEHTWGKRGLKVLDPFSGGGSIPFEALRYGFETYANELNPVASVILKATLDYPFRFGPKLAKDIEHYGAILASRVQERLKPYFTDLQGEYPDAVGAAYIWARTVKCPYTGKPIPLSPNWWLAKGANPVAVRPLFDADASEARFQILRGKEVSSFDPDQGTVKRGNAVSPWAHNQPVDGDYIKAEAQAGRMGQQLYALAAKRHGGFDFRPPNGDDMAAVTAAENELARILPTWEAKGWVPTEERYIGPADRSVAYGMKQWTDAFTPRQLLSLCTYLEVYHDVCAQVRDDHDPERAAAIQTYLALPLDKAADYNSRMVLWHSGRSLVGHTFDRHDFSFKWSHAEFDASRNLFPWAIKQVAKATKGLATIASADNSLYGLEGSHVPLVVRAGPAANLQNIRSGSIDAVCVDPPYYDNVMYAECADFFYVWMKRALGSLHPEFFNEDLTNKDDEAVANDARFASMGRKKKALALEDYERKMASAFREMHRVLADDGVLTVMFTHKKVEAWDTLATSLIGAGFAIHSSWPVHTESEHSLHQAKKNAAQSTIMLTCRKRAVSTEPVWWDDLKGRIRRVAREKAEEFEAQGIRGVDLYIATFGPTLAILSENWPVLTSEVDERTGEPKPLRPEVALDLAREEVIDLRKQGLLLGRTVAFDPFTDWYLMAWDAFQAQEFPGDEARKLALALGLDLEKQVIAEKKLVTKKSATVLLQPPKARRKRGMVDPDLRTFPAWIDALHTAMLLYQEDGGPACKQLLSEAGLLNDSTFKALVQALLNAIPRTKQKGQFVRPEAETLEKMRLSFFDDLTAPAEEAVPLTSTQHDLFDQTATVADTADDYGDDADLDDDTDPGEEHADEQ